jgi:hypothetical protein
MARDGDSHAALMDAGRVAGALPPPPPTLLATSDRLERRM